MTSVRTFAMALGLVGTLAGVPALPIGAQEVAPGNDAAAPVPDGIWEANNGITRYRVALCGDGELCAYLHWIRPDEINDQTRQFVGQPVFEELPVAGPLKWRGPVTVLGYTVQGDVELVSADELHLTACKFLVLCRSTVLRRAPDGS